MKTLLLVCLLGLAASAQELVKVQQPRQLRGAWVASVANMHWPRAAGLSAEEQRRDLLSLLDRLAEARFNAVFFQIRPEGDALYRSELEPWSRFLSGRQGHDPGYDPLEFSICEAHRRGLEVHAWLNPYRAQAVPPADQPPVAPHLAALQPEHVFRYGKHLWMNPAADEVRCRLVEVCQDLTSRYDLDGIHFDDYFYPYPEGDLPFPDQASYAESGQQTALGDWRRAQVNTAIEEVARGVSGEKDYVRFGISPFGLPAPQRPPGIEGLDQYEKLFADTQLWMDEGWVDYLAPQLYWPSSKTAQAYPVLLEWWKAHAREGRHIFAGINLAALGSKPEWDLNEFRAQFQAAGQGFIVWNITPLLENRQNVVTELFSWPEALTPPMAHRAGREAEPPQVETDGAWITLVHQDEVPWRAYTVYRWESGQWQPYKIARESRVELSRGRWAVAAVARDGVESLARVVDIR